MSRPLKKPLHPKKPIDKAKVGAFLTRLGGGLGQITTSHPIALGLTIMAGASLALIVARKQADGKTWSRSTADELNGLFNGVNTIVAAMAALPIVSAVAGAVGGVLTAKAAPAPGG